MIFADKLIALRKKAGYSQEELAQQLNVTRQSVSKWEGAQSVPDMDKVVMMSRLFGSQTDRTGRTEILRGLTGSERVASANAFLLKAELGKSAGEEE